MRQPVLSIDLMWQCGTEASYIQNTKVTLLAGIQNLELSPYITVREIGTAQDDKLMGDHGAYIIMPTEAIMIEAREAAYKKGFDPGQLDVSTVMQKLVHRWEIQPANIPFLIVQDDYSAEYQGTREAFIFGCTRPPACATVSTFRYRKNNRIAHRQGLFSIAVLHELGHVLGAPDEERGVALQDWLGPHCTNPCLMRQRDDLSDFEDDVFPDYRQGVVYCTQCALDIHAQVGAQLQTLRSTRLTG